MLNRKNLREPGLPELRKHQSMVASHGGPGPKTQLATMNPRSKRQILGFFGLFEPLKSPALVSILSTLAFQGSAQITIYTEILKSRILYLK